MGINLSIKKSFIAAVALGAAALAACSSRLETRDSVPSTMVPHGEGADAVPAPPAPEISPIPSSEDGEPPTANSPALPSDTAEPDGENGGTSDEDQGNPDGEGADGDNG